MAVITKDTFDPLRRYVGVRLQQGVPILDADVNEREDIRQFELRAFLKWFVRDGVPEGNEGFRIEGTSLSNDFMIKAGAPPVPSGTSSGDKGLGYVGRCLVDGQDVIIENDIQYTKQPLTSQAEADRLGVPVVRPQPTTRPHHLYLDVWTRIVTTVEEPGLVQPGLGTETCVRRKREWVVRARTQTPAKPGAPKPGEDEYKTDHSYYALAVVARRTSGVVTGNDVADLRERRLLLPPASLIEDTIGVAADKYRRGEGRPILSLRDAINALLRGEKPATPETPLNKENSMILLFRSAFIDDQQRVVAFWPGTTSPALAQIYGARLNQNDIAAGFTPGVQMTPSGVQHVDPSAVLLPSTGEILLAYTKTSPAGTYYKRATFDKLAVTTETLLAPNMFMPQLVVAGKLVIFFVYSSVTGTSGVTTTRWKMQRYNYENNTWMETSPVDVPLPSALSGTPNYNAQREFHTVVDNTGKVWVIFRVDAIYHTYRFDPLSTPASAESNNSLTNAVVDVPHIFARADSPHVYIFFRTGANISYVRWNGTGYDPPGFVAGTTNVSMQPAAAADVTGLWLFYTDDIVGGDDVINQARLDWKTNVWASKPLGTTSSERNNNAPLPLTARNNSVMLIWTSDRSKSIWPYFKFIAPQI
jgi:hypothetical protein